MAAISRCPVCQQKFHSSNGLDAHIKAKGHYVKKSLRESKFNPDRTQIPVSKFKLKTTENTDMSIPRPEYMSSITVLFPGQRLPDTLMHKLIAENTSAFGMAVRTDKEISIEKFGKLDMRDPEQQFEMLKKIDGNVSKFARMYCFHSFPTEFDEDEIQPFEVIKDSKGKAILVVAIEGDFPKFAGGEYSESYHLLYDWLGSELQGIYQLAGNSPSKLFDYAKGPQFKFNFEQIIGHRGFLGFLPNVGEAFALEKNELGVSATWGQCSNAYGYTESAVAAATVEQKQVEADTKLEEVIPPAPKKSKFDTGDDFKGHGTTAPVAPTPQPDKIPQVIPPAPKTPEERVAAKFVESVEERAPPANMHGKALKKWYQETSGGLPKNWADRPTVSLKVKRSVPNEPAQESSTVAQTAAIPISGPTMPVISGDRMKEINEYTKKHLGDGSAVITDPTEANAIEDKLATWHELMAASGVKALRDILQWKTEFVFANTRAHPDQAALCIIELRREVKRLDQMLADADKKLGELAGTTKPTTATTASTDTGTKPVSEPRKSKFA